MELNEYQKKCLNTWIGGEKLIRSFLGVCGEAGELSEGAKKYLRGDFDVEELKKRSIGELGDVLYYVSVCAHELGLTLEEVGKFNNEKLAKRFAEGKIRGDGDKR
ncbi:MAG: nucleoside triphosphate pyrophosphohydrolase family protein [Candidatus Omnitrophica bacterium]|nr:nucleoside triphosphate pyrophosphohydrolase family protein [Candidatus Omnitrophota bacterium]